MWSDARVQGSCRDNFAAVGDTFAANFRERDDLGAAVCITVDGETRAATAATPPTTP